MRFYIVYFFGSHIYEKLNFIGNDDENKEYYSWCALVSNTNDGNGFAGSSVDW